MAAVANCDSLSTRSTQRVNYVPAIQVGLLPPVSKQRARGLLQVGDTGNCNTYPDSDSESESKESSKACTSLEEMCTSPSGPTRRRGSSVAPKPEVPEPSRSSYVTTKSSTCASNWFPLEGAPPRSQQPSADIPRANSDSSSRILHSRCISNPGCQQCFRDSIHAHIPQYPVAESPNRSGRWFLPVRSSTSSNRYNGSLVPPVVASSFSLSAIERPGEASAIAEASFESDVDSPNVSRPSPSLGRQISSLLQRVRANSLSGSRNLTTSGSHLHSSRMSSFQDASSSNGSLKFRESGNQSDDIVGPVTGRPYSKRLADKYVLEEVIGRGQSGVVAVCRHRQSGKTFACKTVLKEPLLLEGRLDELKREVGLLHMFRHENIVSVEEVFEDESAVHIVMELCSGGDLAEFRARSSITTPDGRFTRSGCSERDAARIIRAVLLVVQRCHAMSICHRDLKLSNFMLVTAAGAALDPPHIKAIDFGSAVFCREGETLTEMAGSPTYMAPEVLDESYGLPCDIWSVGVMLYSLLAGYPPFEDASVLELFRKIKTAPLDLESRPWGGVSEGAKEVVRMMLNRDPDQRPRAAEVCEHAWFLEQKHECEQMLEDVCEFQLELEHEYECELEQGSRRNSCSLSGDDRSRLMSAVDVLGCAVVQ